MIRFLIIFLAFAVQACTTTALALGVLTVGGDHPSSGVHLDVTGQPIVQIQALVTGPSMERARAEILAAAKVSRGVVLVINSPGGEVLSGLMFINVMRQLQQDGVTFTCLVPTMAASMAFMILSECNKRYVWEDSLLLFHPVKVGVQANLSAEIATRIAKDLSALEDPLKDRLVTRMGVSREWFEEHYRAETFHRGSTLAAKAPNFMSLVASYTGITPAQLNPPPAAKSMMDLLFGGTEAPGRGLIWITK